MMGAERRTLVMTEEEKRLTAYHEAGHALVALNVPATDPVHKATIIPRGRALGMVMQLPERDKLSMSFEQMTSRLAIMMGGRVAEEMIFGKDKVTSGAASDIQQATRLARTMVTRWGFSRRARHRRLRREPGGGLPRLFGGAPAERLRGRRRRRSTPRSAGWSSRASPRRRRILTEKRDELETLAQGLLEYETLTGDEIKGLLAGKPPVRETRRRAAAAQASAVPGHQGQAQGGRREPDAGMEPQPQAIANCSRDSRIFPSRFPARAAGLFLHRLLRLRFARCCLGGHDAQCFSWVGGSAGAVLRGGHRPPARGETTGRLYVLIDGEVEVCAATRGWRSIASRARSSARCRSCSACRTPRRSGAFAVDRLRDSRMAMPSSAPIPSSPCISPGCSPSGSMRRPPTSSTSSGSSRGSATSRHGGGGAGKPHPPAGPGVHAGIGSPARSAAM